MQDDFMATIQTAYDDTTALFTRLSTDEHSRKYVCPPALHGQPGFAILYTPPAFMPDLAIIGQNPANFAGNGSWTAEPNAMMLRGTIPQRNSYREDRHYFANSLGRLFDGHEDLLTDAIGLNVWHFQASSEDAKVAPRGLKRFCDGTTRTVVAAMKPKAILCFSRSAFYALSKNCKGSRVDGSRKSEWLDVAGSRLWYVPHPTSSYTHVDAAHDSPVVLAAIAAYIARRPR